MPCRMRFSAIRLFLTPFWLSSYSKTKNPHRLARMFLIGVFTDEDSSLELARSLRPAVFRRDSGGRLLTAVAALHRVFRLAL